jgi:hypothetical protein
MRKKLLSACIVAALGAGYAAAAFSQAKPETLVKQRKAAMTMQGKYFYGSLNPMAQGKIPYDAAAAARNAGYLEVLSKLPWDGFAESTRTSWTCPCRRSGPNRLFKAAGPASDRGGRARRATKATTRRREGAIGDLARLAATADNFAVVARACGDNHPAAAVCCDAETAEPPAAALRAVCAPRRRGGNQEGLLRATQSAGISRQAGGCVGATRKRKKAPPPMQAAAR